MDLEKSYSLFDNQPQKDFFVTDIFDNLPVKDDIASMSYPIFSLSKNKDFRQIDYKKGEICITIAPSIHGLPTIFDKDILLYCASLLMVEVNKGNIPPKTLRISVHDFLKTTNKVINGDAYNRIEEALKRLQGVSIHTSIKTNGIKQLSGFHLIESYHFIKSYFVKDRRVALQITLSEWFYNSVIGKEVLTINRDYFKLRKPIERRLYEIARKHCGNALQWEIKLDKLMEKTGSTDTLRKFKLRIKEIAQEGNIPDYSFQIDENEKITFFQKKSLKGQSLNLKTALLEHITNDTFQKAKRMAKKARLDFEELLSQWYLFVEKNGSPENPNGALIGFIKHKVDRINV